MKSIAITTLLSIAALSSGSLAVVTMNISKPPKQPLLVGRSLLAARKDFSESIANNFTGANYNIAVQVGTPAQDITMAIDTGSSDVWVLSVNAGLCTSSAVQDQVGTGCQTPFNSADSSSFKVIDANDFDITYGDGSGASGDYFTDVLNLGGGASLTAQTMGIAHNSTLSPGLLGIGYDTNEASDALETPFIYSSVVDSMVTQGLISLKAYSLYLNDLDASTGVLIFGGLDSDKYQGNLVQLPVLPDEGSNGASVYQEFNVALTSYAITSTPGKSTTLTDGSFQMAALLDSGTSLTYLPTDLTSAIYNELDGAFDEESQLTFFNCDLLTQYPDLTFDYGFGGSSGGVIRVPIVELILPASEFVGDYQPNVSFANPCAMGILPQDQAPYILGDTFLRSAYVVYDLANNVIGIGQTNFDSTTSNIVDFAADASSITSVSGAPTSSVIVEPSGTGASVTNGASQSGSTETTGIFGSLPTTGLGLPTGGQGTSSSTGSSVTSSSTGKASAGVTTTPFDFGGMVVVGVSAAFAVLGGVLMLA